MVVDDASSCLGRVELVAVASTASGSEGSILRHADVTLEFDMSSDLAGLSGFLIGFGTGAALFESLACSCNTWHTGNGGNGCG